MIRLTQEMAISILEWRNGNVTTERIDAICKSLIEQLNHPSHANDLFDTVAGLLMLPGQKNTLTNNGKVIQGLRDAILNPSELAKVNAIARGYQACCTCKREIPNGEVISMHGQLPYCYMCAPPTYIMCGKCKKAHAIPTGAHRILTKVLKECKCEEQVVIEQDEIREARRARVPAPPPLRTFATPPIGPEVFQRVVFNNGDGVTLGQWVAAPTQAANEAPQVNTMPPQEPRATLRDRARDRAMEELRRMQDEDGPF